MEKHNHVIHKESFLLTKDKPFIVEVDRVSEFIILKIHGYGQQERNYHHREGSGSEKEAWALNRCLTDMRESLNLQLSRRLTDLKNIESEVKRMEDYISSLDDVIGRL